MIPTYDSLPTKSQQAYQNEQEKIVKLKQLDEKIKELERFQQFSEINELLKESESHRYNVENIYFIDITINKINKLIQKLSEPAQYKLKQFKFLKTLIEKYFDQNQTSLDDVLTSHYEKLQEELEKKIINKEEIAKKISIVDQDLIEHLQKILEKMIKYLQNKEVISNYEEYRLKIIEYFFNSNENEDKLFNEVFQNIELLEASIKEFENSILEFENRQTWFNYYKDYINNTDFVESSDIEKMKSEIQISLDSINSFNPQIKTFYILDEEASSIVQKLNELHVLNQTELKKQQDLLLSQIENSKNNLARHAKKLNSDYLQTKLGKNKYQAIENIQQKMNAFLESGANQEHASSSEEIIIDLQQTINEAKAILSEYRGISLLRCFATLWGGGKVTSQLLVETLEEQLSDLQNNITKLPLRL